MPQSILLSLGLYSGFSILGIIAVHFLPIETKGRALQVRNNTTLSLITFMKKLLGSDWFREMQFPGNTV